MKVKDLIEWLKGFEDQDADVLIIEHDPEGGYYCQGGTAQEVTFDPEKHAEYTDMRGNKSYRRAPLMGTNEPYFSGQ